MLLHYIKSSVRYMRRIAAYSFLNIAGLTIGISASAFLYIYVWDELRYDRFHSKHDSIFRVLTEQPNGTQGVTTPGPLGDMMLEKYSQISNMARVGKWSGAFKIGDQLFEESEVYFVDNAFFKIFDFQLLKGEVTNVLRKTNEILLTEKTALKFFGENWENKSDLIGHSITMNGTTEFVIAGVVQNPPSYSSIQFDYLLSFEFIKGDRWNYQWGSHNFHTYLELQPTTDIASFQTLIADDIKATQFNESFSLKLQPLSEIYMQTFQTYDWGRHGNPQYVLAFAIIGTLILLVACFNYVNLATSQLVRRAKEIGIRKINGAGRLNIFFQFMGESFLVVLGAALIARAIVDLLLPYFNNLAGKRFVIETFQFEISILFLTLVVVTSFLAGFYPALTLANLKSLSIIKHTAKPASKNAMRTILVTSQFTIALVLVITTIAMFGQLSFMQNKSLGFDKDEIAYIKLAGSLKRNNENLKNDLLKLSYVKAATRSTTTLVNTDNGSYIEWPGKKQGEEVTITQMNVDTDFMSTLNIKLQAGRNFVETDSNSYILNETAVKAMGLTPQKALGMQVKFWGTEGQVVGIVDDFHFRPLHHAITPLIMRHNLKENFFQLLVKVDDDKIKTLMHDASLICKRYEENFPFSAGIVDDLIEKEYQAEQRVGRVVIVFSGLAIIISLLGVVGLVSHSIQERTKEFCIRKILGLRFQHLLVLLSQKLFASYLIATFIATPIAYILIGKWMQNFSYRMAVSPNAFAIGCVGIFALVMTIILIQSFHQIRKNTLDSLRSE